MCSQSDWALTTLRREHALTADNADSDTPDRTITVDDQRNTNDE